MRKGDIVAKIVLEVLYSPFGEGVGVGLLTVEAGGKVFAGFGAVGGVYPDFQTKRVDFLTKAGMPLAKVTRSP